jgi:hypothetical protein
LAARLPSAVSLLASTTQLLALHLKPSDTELRGVLEDVNVREVNDLIQSGDKRLTVAAADVAAVPSTADRVLIGGITHQIIRVTTVEQDNEPITHELILRV